MPSPSGKRRNKLRQAKYNRASTFRLQHKYNPKDYFGESLIGTIKGVGSEQLTPVRRTDPLEKLTAKP